MTDERSSTDADLAAHRPAAAARIDGAAPFAELARLTVALAGDVNGDVAAYILVGAPGADYNGRVTSGSAYVIFGVAGLRHVDLIALCASGAPIAGADSGRLRPGGGSTPPAMWTVTGMADILVDTAARPPAVDASGSWCSALRLTGLDLATRCARRGVRILRSRRRSPSSSAPPAPATCTATASATWSSAVNAVPRGRAYVVLGSAAPVRRRPRGALGVGAPPPRPVGRVPAASWPGPAT